MRVATVETSLHTAIKDILSYIMFLSVLIQICNSRDCKTWEHDNVFMINI